MKTVRLTSSGGFTLVVAMAIVVVMGVMMGVASQSWRMIIQREREEELLFRGVQSRDAIARWYKPPPVQQGQFAAKPLRKMEDLLQDPGSAGTVKYLRKLYKDPITNKEFVPILDASQGIVGVRSSSDKKPIKIGNFTEDLNDFKGKVKYSDWQFNSRSNAYVAFITGGTQGPPGVQAPGSSGISGIPGGSGITGGSGDTTH